MGREGGQKKKIPWKELGQTRLLLLGAAMVGLLLLAWPGSSHDDEGGRTADQNAENPLKDAAGAGDVNLGNVPAAAAPKDDYAGDLENRLEKLLVSMDGVGQVKVMITLKTSEEMVLQTDTSISTNMTSEQDSSGGSRQVEEIQTDQSTVLPGGSSGEPYVVQQIMPQIEGIVVLCDGGGKATVKTEISEAVGALFDVPAHKIKVLKRVSGKS